MTFTSERSLRRARWSGARRSEHVAWAGLYSSRTHLPLTMRRVNAADLFANARSVSPLALGCVHADQPNALAGPQDQRVTIHEALDVFGSWIR
jgi:hypothetical protein